MNLLNNAVDALEKSDLQQTCPNNPTSTPESIKRNPKTIKISTEVIGPCELDASNSEPTPNSQSIVIRISDNGPGIPKEVKKRIFDPFFTTKPVGEGTGLGLSISYQIVVEKHGGQLRCISEPGQGTEFVVEIPLTPPALKSEPTLESPRRVG
jgi:signal transduction histidine kinase